MRIAVDAMGGDYSPREAVRGGLQAVAEKNLEVIFVGREQEIREELVAAGYQGDLGAPVSVVDAPEVITMDEHPATAVRKKRNSSIVVANRLVKEGAADAVVSAGNTGAAMAASLLTLGRIPGIARPAIAIPMPTLRGVTILLDAGANADCDPTDLLQFGLMGAVYAEAIMGIASPQVRLLSIGEEETKGNRLVLESHQIFKESGLNFTGNVEGQDLLTGVCDVVVCDGFVGNIVLKLTEGVAGTLLQQIKEIFTSSLPGKAAALLVKKELQALRNRMDYSEYGGAPLLGVQGIAIISHGRSKAKAFKNAVLFGAKAVEENLVTRIRQAIEEHRGPAKQ
ncbi:MAG: phosphate acyltransferase PlsX [Clostridia bacterium]|nr:phosphate acyltransferase PlsX [Clostridia bacterium]